MTEIRIAEFKKDKYSRNRLLFEDDIKRTVDQLRTDWAKEEFTSLEFVRFSVAQDDKTLYILTFDLSKSCTNAVVAAQKTRKAILRGISKAGFICDETTPLAITADNADDSPTKITKLFSDWTHGLEFRKRTMKTMFTGTGFWKRLLLPLVLLLLLLALVLCAIKGCEKTDSEKPTVGPIPPSNLDVADFHKFEAVDDAVAVTQETPQNIEVLENDRYLAGKEIVELTVTNPGHGTAKVQDSTDAVGNKTILYSPEAGFTGTDSFQYSVKLNVNSAKKSEVRTEENSATVRIVVSEKGDRAPIVFHANNDYRQFHQGTKNLTFDIDVLANDKYPASQTTLLIEKEPQNGKVAKSPEDHLLYTPHEGFTGHDSFEYTIKHEDHSSTATVSLDILPYDNSMFAENDVAQTTMDEPVKIDVLKNDIYQGVKPSITIVEKPLHGSVEVKNDIVEYTPVSKYVGNDTFMYSITGDQPLGTAAVAINITGANSDSKYGIANNDEYDVTAGQEIVFYPLENDIAPADGSQLKIYSITKPDYGTAMTDGTRIHYQSGKIKDSDQDYIGLDTIEYMIAPLYDPEDKDYVPSGVHKGYILIHVLPVPSAAETQTVAEVPAPELPNTSHTLYVKPDSSEKLELESGVTPQIDIQPVEGTAVVEDNVITYHAGSNPGEDSFVYKDTTGNQTGRVEVIVSNDEAQPLPDQFSTPKNQRTILNVLVNDKPEDDNNEIESISKPVNGDAQISEDKKTISYTPNPNFIGWDSLSYSSKNAPDKNIKAKVFVYDKETTIPTVADGNQIAYDDTVYTGINTPVKIHVLENDYPVEDLLRIQKHTQPANGTVALAKDCSSIEYTPNKDFSGYDSFTYTIDDNPQGTGIVTVVVGDEPAGKNIAHNDDVSTYKNTPVDIFVLRNDQRVGEAPISISNPPQLGTAKVVNNQIKYVPNKDIVGRDYFDYYIGNEENANSSAKVCVHIYDNTIEAGGDSVPYNTVKYGSGGTINSGRTVNSGNTVIEHTPDDVYVVQNGDEIIDIDDGGTHITKTYTPGTKIIRRGDDVVVRSPDGVETTYHGGTWTRKDGGTTVFEDVGGDVVTSGDEQTQIEQKLEVISKTDASNIVIILDDTQDVKKSIKNLENALSKSLDKRENDKQEKVTLSCIVVDDKQVRKVLEKEEISNEQIHETMNKITDTLTGSPKWDTDGKIGNFVNALTVAAKLSSSSDKSKTFLISDGDSYTAYTQALSDGTITLPEEVKSMKKKMINLPTAKSKK